MAYDPRVSTVALLQLLFRLMHSLPFLASQLPSAQRQTISPSASKSKQKIGIENTDALAESANKSSTCMNQ
jgi:hypothetical protein